MPTGYTYKLLENPEMSFTEFAEICVRAMGVAILLRDEPMEVRVPEAFAPDPYHLKRIHESEEELRKLETMTLEEAEKLASDSYDKRVVEHAQGLKERTRENKIFKRMLDKVKAWTPPSEKHENFKKFMTEQLESSIDEELSYYKTPPSKLTAVEWIAQRNEVCRFSLERAREEWKKEQERTTERNEWIKLLRESFDEVQKEERKGG